MNEKKRRVIIIISVIATLVVAFLTICGKAATHKNTNYGFCDKHWGDAMNYG